MKKVILTVSCLLAALLFSVNLHAQTSISVTSVNDLSLQPTAEGTFFNVEVWAHNVSNLWGWQFALYFDPNFIQAVDYAFGPSFPYPAPSEIGYYYVALAATSYMGDLVGITAEHVLLATVTFVVVGTGYSDLYFDPSYTMLSTPFGVPITLLSDSLVNGCFSNITQEDSSVPEVDLVKRAAWQEHQWRNAVSKVENELQKLTLYARVKNFSSTKTYKAKVKFIVMSQPQKNKALNTYTLYTPEIDLALGAERVVSVTADFLTGMYIVTAQAFYLDDTRISHGSCEHNTSTSWKAGSRIKRFGFPLQ